MTPLLDLKIRDLWLIHQLRFATSLRELGRQTRIDPQNLTKRVSLIEEIIGEKLIDRSTSGYQLTQQGYECVERVAHILEDIETLSAPMAPTEKRWRICGRAYLIDFFIRYCFPDLKTSMRKVGHFDFMDLSPELAERAARKGQLELVLSLGDVSLGPEWQNARVGEITWGFYVRKGHPLKGKVFENAENYKVLSFCYIESDKMVGRPSPVQSEIGASRGTGIENSRFAISTLLQTDEIAYLPDIAVSSEPQLRQVHFKNTNPLIRPVFLHAHIDQIRSSDFERIKKNLTTALKKQ